MSERAPQQREQREVELAAKVVSWLEAEGWDVYQEVTCRGSICDIVALQGPLLWAIECKTHFGLDVIDQASGWRRLANIVSIATPHSRVIGKRRVHDRVLEMLDVGALVVNEYSVQEVIRPVLYRRVDSRLRESLRPEHKTFAKAGNASGSRYTPFQATCAELARFVEANEGCTLRDAIAAIRHHYHSTASARGALRVWIEKGIVDGVTLRRDGKTPRLYRREAA